MGGSPIKWQNFGKYFLTFVAFFRAFSLVDRLIGVLAEIDREMSQSKTARGRRMPIAFALGLPSSYETR